MLPQVHPWFSLFGTGLTVLTEKEWKRRLIPGSRAGGDKPRPYGRVARFLNPSLREIGGKNISKKFKFGLESEKYGKLASRRGIEDRVRIAQ
jgi:hypothetical protein